MAALRGRVHLLTLTGNGVSSTELAAATASREASAMTAQDPDTIRFAGTTYPLMCNPFNSFFDQGHPRPAVRSREHGELARLCRSLGS
jgi:hypothetical protein